MAERKISTKFAIEGESEYKAAVKGINQEMKVLNSEMAKTASEFSNAQNSMEALSAKSEVLAKQSRNGPISRRRPRSAWRSSIGSSRS